jgi:hypothetical protein
VIQLYAVVEGETEQEFFKRVVAPHLVSFEVFAIPVTVMTKRERDGRKHKGGGDWTKWKEDIRRYCLDQRPSVRITTLFDLYGLPKNFPELEQHAQLSNTAARATALEQAMANEIGDTRFLPYLQRHEFEALVLASLPELEKLLEGPDDRAGLQKLRDHLGSLAPEDVNDGRATAPSKRPQLQPRRPPQRRRQVCVRSARHGGDRARLATRSVSALRRLDLEARDPEHLGHPARPPFSLSVQPLYNVGRDGL